MVYTAHSRTDLSQLLLEVPSLNVHLNSDQAADALFMYLMKLRTAKSDTEIGFLFNVSRDTVARRIEMARKSLKRDVVPKYVNREWSRDELIAHKTVLSHKLFDDGNQCTAHIILDGTYIFIEKSKSHQSQKGTYNSHKKRNYVKVMVGTAPDGFIIFVAGPFMAGANDASITSTLLSENIPALKNFQPEDVAIVDRGFRDCVVDLVNKGFIVKTPACSALGTQLTTKEANKTRLVTRVRFDIERMNGVMKNTWKTFGAVYESQKVPVMMTDFEIASALINRKKTSLARTDASSELIAARMLSRLDQPNELDEVIRKPYFKKFRQKEFILFENPSLFPKLTMDDLFAISCGPYQIEQAKYYGRSHLEDHNNQFEAFTLPDDVLRANSDLSKLLANEGNAVLIMTSQKSRFVSTTVHRSYVVFDPFVLDYQSILHYCCDCKVGRRTVGCCSHVMCIIHFFGYAQYNGGIAKVAKHLENIFDRESCEHEENVDLDDDVLSHMNNASGAE